MPQTKQHAFLKALLAMKPRTIKEALWKLEMASMYYETKLEG